MDRLSDVLEILQLLLFLPTMQTVKYIDIEGDVYYVPQPNTDV